MSKSGEEGLLKLALTGALLGIGVIVVAFGVYASSVKPKSVRLEDITGDGLRDVIVSDGYRKETPFIGKEDGTFVKATYKTTIDLKGIEYLVDKEGNNYIFDGEVYRFQEEKVKSFNSRPF